MNWLFIQEPDYSQVKNNSNWIYFYNHNVELPQTSDLEKT